MSFKRKMSRGKIKAARKQHIRIRGDNRCECGNRLQAKRFANGAVRLVCDECGNVYQHSVMEYPLSSR